MNNNQQKLTDKKINKNMSTIETNTIKPEISFLENDNNYLIIENKTEVSLDTKIQEIDNFMRENSGKGKSDKEKDDLYKSAQNLWKNYASQLKDSKYNFHLNRPQYKFLTDLILSKMDYDVNTVFFAIELTELLGNMKEVKFNNDTDLVTIPVNATEITYIYHLIAKHKVKGLTKDAYLFANILKRIGSISKIFNYYDTTAKNLSNDIQAWVSTFEESVSYDKIETVEAKVSKPKKEKV